MANSTLGLTRNYNPTDNDNDDFNWFMCFAGGNVVLDLQGGDQVTISAVPAFIWMPCGNAVGIASTGTTATGLMVVGKVGGVSGTPLTTDSGEVLTTDSLDPITT